MSKKTTIYCAVSLLLLLTLVMPACDWFKRKTEQVRAEMSEPKLRLLDADSAEVYNDAHIPGAINVSFEGIDELSKGWNKDTPVVVYCSSYECEEKYRIAKRLKKDLGFNDVRVFAGGMHEWYKLSKENKAAYPVEGEAKQAYLEKEIAKAEPKEEEGIHLVSAADLSKLLEEAKAPAVVPSEKSAEPEAEKAAAAA